MCLVLTTVVSYLQRIIGYCVYLQRDINVVLTAVVSYLQRDINVFGIDSSCFILTT